MTSEILRQSTPGLDVALDPILLRSHFHARRLQRAHLIQLRRHVVQMRPPPQGVAEEDDCQRDLREQRRDEDEPQARELAGLDGADAPGHLAEVDANLAPGRENLGCSILKLRLEGRRGVFFRQPS